MDDEIQKIESNFFFSSGLSNARQMMHFYFGEYTIRKLLSSRTLPIKRKLSDYRNMAIVQLRSKTYVNDER
jgi:hypothetical protein